MSTINEPTARINEGASEPARRYWELMARWFAAGPQRIPGSVRPVVSLDPRGGPVRRHARTLAAAGLRCRRILSGCVPLRSGGSRGGP